MIMHAIPMVTDTICLGLTVGSEDVDDIVFRFF